MSRYRLNTSVHAVELGDDGRPTGRSGTFGPGDDLSTPANEWAVAAIDNPDVWAGEKPPRRTPPARATSPDTDQAAEIARLRAELAELKSAQQAPDGGQEQTPVVPPRSGPGSSAQAWRDYAAALEVQVPEDASRDDVLKALEASGKPIE